MKKNAKYIILSIGILSLIVVGALASLPDSNTKQMNNDETLYGESSASLIPFNQSELRTNSDTIVIGTVKEILPSKWNSIDGKKPNDFEGFSTFCLIYTDIIIYVDEYLENPLSSKEVTVRVEGGTVGNDTLTTESEPTFKPGEKVLIYLTKDTNTGTKDIGPEHFRITGSLQGKYTLTDDGKAVRLGKTVSQNELLNTIKNKSAV